MTENINLLIYVAYLPIFQSKLQSWLFVIVSFSTQTKLNYNEIRIKYLQIASNHIVGHLAH